MAENDEHTAGDLKKLLVDKFQEYGMTGLDINHCQVLPGHQGCKQAEESGLGEPASRRRGAVPQCYFH